MIRAYITLKENILKKRDFQEILILFYMIELQQV